VKNLKTQKAQVGRNGIGTAVAFFIDGVPSYVHRRKIIYFYSTNSYLLLVKLFHVGVGKLH
jgi:hypothetical protein